MTTTDADSAYPPLRPEFELCVCLTCGSVVPRKGIVIHDGWHQALGANDPMYSVAQHVREVLADAA